MAVLVSRAPQGQPAAGRDRVYRDIDSNRAGQDYVQQIRDAVARSQVMIAVIGREWSSAADDQGALRLSQADDPIRLELESAFAEDVATVPVLVDNAAMPQKRDLPASIERFARIQARRMSDDDWEYDLRRLLETLEDHGVFPGRVSSEQEPSVPAPAKPPAISRYERTLKGSRTRVFDVLATTVEALGYQVLNEDAAAAEITFKPRSAPASRNGATAVGRSEGEARNLPAGPAKS